MIRRPVVAGLISVLFLTLALPALAAPQNSPDSATIFTSNSELVLVPVQVLDHYGRPLHGLKQDDFVVKSDGKPQRIGLFEEMQTPPVPATKPPLILLSAADSTPAPLPEKFTNLRRDALPQQLFIVVIDNVNTPIRLQSWAREQLVKYLQNSSPRQPMEVVAITPTGLRRVHEFTTDTAALIDSIRKMHSSLGPQDSPEPLLSRMDPYGRIDSYASLVN